MRNFAFGSLVACVGLSLFGFAGCGADRETPDDGTGGRAASGGTTGDAGAPETGDTTTGGTSGGDSGLGGAGGAGTGAAGEGGSVTEAGAAGSATTGAVGGAGDEAGGEGGGPAAGGSGGAGDEAGGEGGEPAAGGSGAGDGLRVASTFKAKGSLCGVAIDPAASLVWAYRCSSTTIDAYAPDGTLSGSVTAPGGAANDADVEIAPAFTLGETEVPAGAVLFINGETGVAEVHAQDSEDDSTTSTLTTAFGASHVVGGAYHAERGTLFLVQDRVPSSAALKNLVAEISPETGEVLNEFSILPDYDVNYGDLDVCAATGNLFLVSSSQSSIGEFTPDGSFVATYPLPSEVRALSGIGIDDTTGEAWVGSTNGSIWRLAGFPCE